MKQKQAAIFYNRGVWFSLLLVVGIVVYVLITQLQQNAVKKELTTLTNGLQEKASAAWVMSEETLSALKAKDTSPEEKTRQAQAQKEQQNVFSEALRDRFSENSQYVDVAANQLFQECLIQADGGERIHSLSLDRVKVDSFTMDDTVASVSYTYVYKMDYEAYNYALEDTDRYPDGSLTVKVSMSYVKQDGAWRIYRLSQFSLARSESFSEEGERK